MLLAPNYRLFALILTFLTVLSVSAQDLVPTEIVHVDGVKWGYKDKTTGVRVGKAYDYAYPFINGYAVVKNFGKFGYVDAHVKEITFFKYDKCEEFINGYARVTIGSKMGFVDSTGKEICPVKYVRLRPFSEGFATASEEETGRTGFIDKKGRMFSRFHYDNAGSYKDGYAWVEKDGAVGMVDRKGNEVIPLQFDWVDPEGIHKGTLIVQKKKIGVINIRQQPIIPIEYDDVKHFGEHKDFFLVVKGKKGKERYGIFTLQGKQVLPPNFIRISEFEHGGEKNYAKVYFDPLVSKQPFFYINGKMECEEHEGVGCPEK